MTKEPVRGDEVLELKEEIQALRLVISKIHNIKEPGQFVDTQDTINMVQDLYNELKEETEKISSLEKKVGNLEHYKSIGASALEAPPGQDSEELRIAIVQKIEAEKDLKQLAKIVEQRGKSLHPLFGSCDDTDINVCSVCSATKKVADNSEKYLQELVSLRKIIFRSEIIMRRVAWNRKMQNPDDIIKTEEQAGEVAVEMQNVLSKTLK